ncbi:MAG: right-handed parallel beta-helix repeat-containing protein, partial [Candidatus Thermoplasmatota archaeon]|nr:right-handed parallel beta-helix repeat-containing protein [Candidatus Thermoplasmatota archaeon]
AAFIWLITAVLLFASFVLQSEKTSAGTSVGGPIPTDTNWTMDGSPYDVIDNITVENGATLTIEAGVQVIFNDRNYILVNGTLRSLGRSDRKVVFMPFQPWVTWEGLIVTRYGHLELRNSTILKADDAVVIHGSENNVMSGNNFVGSGVVGSPGDGNKASRFNTIEGNTFQSGGIYLAASHNYTIRGNRLIGFGISGGGDGHIIEDNYLEGTGGISLRTSNSTIRGNVFFDNEFAVSLHFSENNEICGNWIENSRMYAIYVNCTGCRVWNNSFIANPLLFGSSQGMDENGLSYWNESYPTGGNYWSNFAGHDQFRGPAQNFPGSDGIGDIPYPIYDTTYDYYPLVNFTPPLPDIAVYDDEIVFDSPSPVEEGESVEISAAIHNIGTENAINAFVRFFDGDPMSGVQIDGDKLIGSLPMKWKEWVRITWTAQGIGHHDICVVADPDDTIRELNEDNNQACASIEVVPAGPPLPPTDLNAHLSGSGFENITITWSLSQDDSAGKNSVARYDIYRADTYSSNTSSYLLHDSVPKGTSEYVDVGSGEGNVNDYFYVVCAVNAANDSSCSANQVAKFGRPLSNGPNLVSIPLVQSNESIETVLQTVEYDKAWYYDSLSGKWKWYMKSKDYRRGLWSMNHTMGIWVNVTENSNLTVAGVVPDQTTMHLYEGWNLVSFPSFNASYSVSDLKAEIGATRLEGYDFTAPANFLRVLGDAELLLTGYGYWVRVETDTDWIVEVS